MPSRRGAGRSRCSSTWPAKHRVAISNSRLVSLDDGQVAFRYKDYAADQRQKVMTLSADEFIRRFLQHVLPRGFVKARHYGLLANRYREAKLDQCRRLLLVVAVAAACAGVLAASVEPEPCPTCGGTAWRWWRRCRGRVWRRFAGCRWKWIRVSVVPPLARRSPCIASSMSIRLSVRCCAGRRRSTVPPTDSVLSLVTSGAWAWQRLPFRLGGYVFFCLYGQGGEVYDVGVSSAGGCNAHSGGSAVAGGAVQFNRVLCCLPRRGAVSRCHDAPQRRGRQHRTRNVSP